MSNNHPLVSIGIPAYNGASSLRIAIESAIAQDYPNIEIVISDDASTDDTPSLCQEFCQRDNRIKYVRQPENLGLTDNFRAVFKATRGEFFMWLSQDDWIEPSYISQCTDFLLANPDYSLACGKPRYFLEEKILFEGDRINLAQDLGTERIVKFYAEVLDNGCLYAVMRRHLLSKWLIPKTMNGDWIQVASMVFMGKIKTLETVTINRQNRWTKPLERAKEFVEGEGLPIFQALKPGISITLSAFKDIAWRSPTYAPLGKLGRFLLAWDVFHVLSQRIKLSLNSSLLSLLKYVDGQYPDTSVLTELRQLREKIADFWLITPKEQLQSAYSGNLGKVHKMLLVSGIKNEPLTDTEQAFVNDLTAQVARGFGAANATQYLLAAMLYRYAHQLPLQYEGEGVPIPQWFFDDYLKFMLDCPEYFQEIGEVDSYYRHWQKWGDRLHSNIFNNPNAQLWQNVALFFTKNAYFVPLYFNSENLKNIFTNRAEIGEFVLKKSGLQLDFSFPERSDYRRKIRLGILKSDFNPQTETFTTIPAFEYLDREQFEIILYALNVTNHPLEQYCSSRADRLVKLPKELAIQVQEIRADELDILLIGNNVTSSSSAIAFLAMHRLARIQVTCYSSPVTTGMSNIDYYISGKFAEPLQGAQDYYREQLIALDGAGTCFSYYPIAADAPTIKLDKKSWNITEESIVFISGANFYKIIPEVRHTWAKIMASVPNSVLILYPFSQSWNTFYPSTPFLDNLKAIFAQYGIEEKRLVILEALPNRSHVKEYLKLGDIYLDSYPYSGSHSTVDALEVGLPTVIKDGNSMRSRQAAALLRELDITDLIADSEEAYIQLAVALATNPEMRRQKRDRIQQQMANNPRFLDSRSYAIQIGSAFQEIFQNQQKLLVKHIDLDSDDRLEITPIEPAIASSKFLNNLTGNANLYQIDPFDESLLAELRQMRKEIADFWLSAATEKLEIYYLGNVGKAHKIMLNSGILNQPLTETEQIFADDLATQIAKEFEQPQALNYLLAAMLYCPVSQLPLPSDGNASAKSLRTGIPQWLQRALGE